MGPTTSGMVRPGVNSGVVFRMSRSGLEIARVKARSRCFCDLHLGARLVAKGRPDGFRDFLTFLRYAWLRVDQADPAQIRRNARNRNS